MICFFTKKTYIYKITQIKGTKGIDWRVLCK